MKLWKWLVGFFFLLVIVDGALRKWVLPSYSTVIFVLKDGVLWGGFFLYALRRSPTELPRPVRQTWIPVLLGAYVFVVLLQAFNLRQPSIIVSAIGLKAHLAYLPLVVLLPALFVEASEDHLAKGLWGYAVLVFLPIAVLGMYQFSQPPTAWINQYVREMQTVSTLVEGVPRITGTFPYIGSFTVYLTFNAFLSVAALLAGLRWGKRSLTILGGILLTASLILLPMTGSRSPVLLVAGGVLALLLVMRSGYGQRIQFLVITAVLVVFVVQGGVGLGVADQGWEAFGERVERAGGVEGSEDRAVNILYGPILGMERAGLFGYGAGASHQAAPRFVPGSAGFSWLPQGYVENGITRLITELGILGWLVLLSLKGVLLYMAYQTVRRSQQPLELIVGATAFCYLLPRLLFPVVFNVVSSALYWGVAGAVLGIWSLQQVRARQAHRAQMSSTEPAHA